MALSERVQKGRGWAVIAWVAMCLLVGPDGGVVRADARTDFLMRMLSGSAQFRVRAQAALALGGQKPEPSIVRALVAALRDENGGVRAASASALERLGDPSALPGLRAAMSDRDGSVRTAARNAVATLTSVRAPGVGATSGVPAPPGTAVYYVGVGVPGSQVGLAASALRSVREHLVSQLAQIQGVSVAPENEDTRTAARVIGAQKLAGYYVDSSITSLEQKPGGAVRAQVSIILGTYPGRDLRAMLSGAATVSGGGDDAKVEAIHAAFTGAVRRLPEAMQAGLARAP